MVDTLLLSWLHHKCDKDHKHQFYKEIKVKDDLHDLHIFNVKYILQ